MKLEPRKYLIGIFAGAALMILSAVWGFWRYQVGMAAGIRSLSSEATLPGLSGHIDTALYGAAIGTGGFVIGLIIFCISLLRFKRAGR